MIEETSTKLDRSANEMPMGQGLQYTSESLTKIAECFAIDHPIEIRPFAARGNINLTYSVMGGDRHYLLQRVNSDVFTMPHRVMNSMLASVQAQRSALAQGLGDPEWQAIELVPTKTGEPFLELAQDWSVWRLMVCIPEVVSFKSLGAAGERQKQLELAEETGRGLGIYTDLTSSMDPVGVEGSLPGYRDTDLYYRQFRSVLAENRSYEQASGLLPQDPIVKSATEQHFLVALSPEQFASRLNDPQLAHFIDLAQSREEVGRCLWKAVDEGSIPRTLIHGDTKLENFLFKIDSYRVRSLVDLDTVMAFTWLADWGDMLRSLVNVAGECEEDLSKIVVDRDVYRAVASGFLKTSKNITQAEVALMAKAVQGITLELGMRFLTDYLRGDTYFQLGESDPGDLNKTRAMVQLTLFEKLEAFNDEAERIVRECRSSSI